MAQNNNDDIIRAIGRLEGKVDGFPKTIAGIIDRLNNHSTRVGKLEVSDGQQNVKIGLIASVAGFIASFIANFTLR